ncbi:Hypothetical protein D9617_10g071940 [Elsinoe fawcettii]|nr:Hypothetical protein D9617_10g071940 [Elsinoe fawcettii]
MISTRAIAEVCIAYIRSIDARCTQSNINQENQYPFATFSGSNCLEYAVACQDQSGDFIRLVRDFLLSKRDFEVYGWLLQSAVPGNVSEDQLRKKDTPLTRTAFLGFDLVAKALIEAGEPFDAVGHSQFSALQEVVWNCSVDTVTMMLDRGADMDLGGGPYHTPIDTLSLAVQTGDLDKVNVLLQYGANVNGHERRPGQPLVCAIKMRHHTIVQLLLQWGPRTIGDFHGFQTALDLAIELGEYSNVTALQAVLLKEKGGVEHWHRLLRRAAFWGPGTLLDSLLAERGSEKKVILPLLLDLFACVFTLFFSADSLRKRSHIRPEALVLAVLAQAPDRVLALLRRGADPNIDSRWFGSALGAAAQKSDVEMVRLLLDYGARPSVRQPDFPLHQAILAADLAAVQLLVRNGADLELEAPDFGTPLMTAASLIVMVCRHEIFPESGFTVRLNETTLKPLEEERTPLEEVFHWLISMGADPNSANAHFKSVTHAIVQSGRPDLVKLLFEHDVVIHAEDLNAWLHAAVDAGSSSTLALLIGRISGVQKGDIHEALRQYRGPPETEEWHRLHRLLVLHDRLASGSPLMTWLRTFQSVSIDDLLDLPLDDDSWFNNYIAGFADDNPWRSMFSGRRRRKASAGWYPWREPQQLWASLARFM